jgi:hypothetical protein
MDQQPPSTPVAPNNSEAPGNNNVIYSSSPNGVVSGGAGAGKGLSKGRLFAIAGAATVVVLGTAAYVFGFYLPNKPENVYNSALVNTGKGYDQLVTYLDNKELASKYKSSETTGSLKVESADFSTDGSFEVKGNEKEGTFKGDIGLGTTRLTVEGVAVDAENSDSPDLYVKVGGIKGLGANFGMPAMDNLDDQWVSIDHSFIDTYLNQLEAAGGLESTASEMTPPKQDDVVDAAKAVGEVNKKYLFTDDATNGVFQMKEYIGSETVDGKDTNRYKVSVNKNNLKAYVKELGEKLDDTKLNDWVKETYDKDISKLMKTEDMAKSVDDIKDGDTFDMWVNKETKLIHKVRFTDSEDKKTFVDLGLNFDGGAEKPFFVSFEGEQDGVKMNMGLTLSINTETDTVKLGATFKQDGDAAVSVDFDAQVKPASGEVKVEVPEGSVTLNEAFSMVGLDGYLELLTQSLQTSLEQQAALQAELAPLSIEQ